MSDGSSNAYGLTAPGTSVPFTATVTGNGLSGFSPSGSIQFYEDGLTVGTPITLTGSGNVLTATKNITIGQSGTHTNDINGSHLITAIYIPASATTYATPASITGASWSATDTSGVVTIAANG